MTMLSLSLLGPFQATLGAEPLTDFRTRKVQALLIYLAAEPQAHSRDWLLNLLWPGLPEVSARSNLRQILYYLRQVVSESDAAEQPETSLVIANRQEIQLNPLTDVTVDTRQFSARLQQSQTHHHLDLFACRECARALEEAVALYRGDFLADFYLDDSNEYEEWSHARREYFRRQALDALSTLAAMFLRRQEYAPAQAHAERQLEIDNLRESAYRQLMEILARTGRREQALAVYDKCRRVLAEELGMAPSTQTTAVYEKIRAGDLQFEQASRPGVRGYELKEEIAEGGYGTIYRAVQPAIQREVAVKVIKRKYANDPEFIRRFEAEAQIVARLEHPYIVPLYDYWRDPEGAFLAMRYMRGGSLLTALKAGPWDISRTAGMLEQIAGALAVAHQQGVVHRDIKPGNILLDEAGNAYLADFGIAKDLAGEQKLTVEGAVLGTLDYTSPEQIVGAEISPRSDIYSLGAVLYEVLTGEKPFSDNSIANLLYSHINEPIPLVAATRPDVSPEIDTVLQTATAKQAAQRYASALELAAAFRNAASAGEMVGDGRAWETLPALVEIYNPYKGLHAFQEADAEDFFGREALVQQLLRRLEVAGGQDSRFLAVVGPSGSGKSSAVKAGLIPALRQGALPGSEKWFVTEMMPGSNPLQELELALWRVAVDPPPDLLAPMQRDTDGILRTIRRILPAERAGRKASRDGEVLPSGPLGSGPQLLLVIDQFEELFTLVADEGERVFFLESLLAALSAPRSPLRLVVTLRADFYDRPLQYPAWGQLFKEHTEIVLPLNRTELSWAVREPARRMGVRLEEGLADAIVADVADQPGALPLLQYAMTELFDEREGRLITRAAFEKLGDVHGALGKRAEAVYDELDEAGRQTARQLFLRLVTLGEGAEDTRRRVLRGELESLTEGEPGADGSLTSPAGVLDRFGAARFLTFDRDPLTRAPTVEVAHEALLREWPRLRAWLAESRDDVRLQRLLAQAAGEWHAAGRDTGYLLRGARLDQFAGWAQTTSVALTAGEQEFVAASVSAREKRLAVDEERRQRELQAARELAEAQQRRAEEQASAASRLRRRAAYLVGALVVAAVLALAAIAAGRQSSRNAALAATREGEALANAELAANREADALANADLAATREVEALNSAQLAAEHQAEAEAEANLRATAEAVAVAERQMAEEQARLASSRELALSSQANLDRDPELSILLALEALEVAHTRQAEEALHRAVQESRLQKTLVRHGGWMLDIAYAPDQTFAVTVGDDGAAGIWDTATGEQWAALELAGMTDAFPGELTYVNADGTQLATLSLDPETGVYVETWDLTDLPGSAPRLSLTTLPISLADPGLNIALSPDWRQLAVGHSDGTAEVWDLATTQPIAVISGYQEWVGVAFTPDGQHLLTVSDDGSGDLWRITESGAERAIAGIQHGGLISAQPVFSADASLLLTSGSVPGEVILWDLPVDEGTAQPRHALRALGNFVTNLALSRDGEKMAITSQDGVAIVYDITGDQPEELHRVFGHSGTILDIEFSPDGEQLGTAGLDGTARLWNASTAGPGELLAANLPAGRATDMALSPDERLLALAYADSPTWLFDAATGEPLFSMEGFADRMVDEFFRGQYSVSFSPDSSRLATGGADGFAHIWDVETGERLLAIDAHDPAVATGGGTSFGATAVRFSPDGSRLASGGSDGWVRVWDAQTGEELFSFMANEIGVRYMEYSPDGRLLATAGESETANIWDAQTGEELHSLPGHRILVYRLAFSPDGSLLATGDYGGLVKVWSVATGEEQYTLPSQGSSVLGMRFSADGRYLATGGGDAVRLWDAATGAELLTLAAGPGSVFFSRDGTRLYYGTFPSGPYMLLALSLEELTAIAESRLTRALADEECRQYLHVEECPQP